MPHYFFHVHDGRNGPDTAGTCIDAFADVRREAIRRAAVLLFDETGKIVIPADWRLDVLDADGTLVFRLAFDGRAPATLDRAAQSP